MKIRFTQGTRRTLYGTVQVVAILLAALVMSGSGTAGIQGSGLFSFVAFGAVTSVDTGTIRVGDVDYAAAGAAVIVDGSPATPAQIQAGNVVALQGVAAGGIINTATQIVSNSNVRGSVSSVDLPSNTFYATGQTIHVGSDTVFDPAFGLAGLAAVQIGMGVEVSGFPDSTGALRATRVSLSGAGAGTQLVGKITGLDPVQQTFVVSSVPVSYAGASVEGALSNGETALVQGTLPVGNAALAASVVQVSPGFAGPPGTQGRIQGLVTAIASDNYFEVEGQPVSVNSGAHLNLQGPLALDVMVKVTGTYDIDGVLVAAKVQSTPQAVAGKVRFNHRKTR